MKMHFLDGGRLRMKRRVFVPTAGREELIELPVISTLFRHATANVLFDTGCHPSVETDAGARWGGLAKFMTPIAQPNANVIAGLAELDLKPEDIDVVVNSHLHPDHCGCNAFFTNATFFCHEAEVAAASVPGADRKGYLRAEWDHPMRLDTVSGQHDVLGDSRLVTIPLPGHTPGMMGLRADLHLSGEFFIVSDAVSLKRNLDNDEVPMNAWDGEKLLTSYETVRERENAGATIICGHDDTQWQTLRTGHQAYE